MTKLKSADHVALLSNLLGQNNWLADYAWNDFYSTLEAGEYVPAPDRIISRSGGLMMVEMGRTEWRGLGRPVYASRLDWDGEKRYRAPFSKRDFRRNSKRKDGDTIVREFMTPYVDIHAITYERSGVIEKVEFITYNGRNVVRTENFV
jgi:hypothetical protein